MAVLKEYRCLAHGPFEGTEARCPKGCTIVQREFRTAPGTRSQKTKITDNAVERLAKRFGMTDMSNRNGSVAASRKVGNLDFSPKWMGVPQGHNLEIGKGIVQREGAAGGAQAMGESLGTGRIADEPSADQSNPLPSAKMPKIRPRIVGRDTVTAADFQHAIEHAP